MNKTIGVIVILFVVAGGVYAIGKRGRVKAPEQPVVVATSTATSTGDNPHPDIVPYQSGVKGSITVGPTCPVEKNPPDPACADRPLSTLVAIFRASDPVHAFVLIRSAADGTFSADVPPGSYVVGAGESNLPRCPQTKVEVPAKGYVSIRVSCDSGIR